LPRQPGSSYNMSICLLFAEPPFGWTGD
jgi:hypothetical protein